MPRKMEEVRKKPVNRGTGERENGRTGEPVNG
jgi:hypothetical protein